MKYTLLLFLLISLSLLPASAQEASDGVPAHTSEKTGKGSEGDPAPVSAGVQNTRQEQTVDPDHVLYRHRIGVSWEAVSGSFAGVKKTAGKNIDDGFLMLDSIQAYPLQVIILLVVCFILFTAAAIIGYRKLSIQEPGDGGE